MWPSTSCKNVFEAMQLVGNSNVSISLYILWWASNVPFIIIMRVGVCGVLSEQWVCVTVPVSSSLWIAKGSGPF